MVLIVFSSALNIHWETVCGGPKQFIHIHVTVYTIIFAACCLRTLLQCNLLYFGVSATHVHVHVHVHVHTSTLSVTYSVHVTAHTITASTTALTDLPSELSER